jgi:phosphohistidine phosphatase
MKTLILMRHAKSSWAEPLQNDFDRPLNDRGKQDAPEMGKRLLKKHSMPNLIVCSTAKRTHKTARLVAEELKYNEHDILRVHELYEAQVHDMLYVIRQLDDDKDTVLLIAHNPTITGMVGYLTGAHIENMPTAGQASISFAFKTWKQVAQETGKLNWLDYPKSIFD